MAGLNKEAKWIVFLRAGQQYLNKNKGIPQYELKTQTKNTEEKKTQMPNLTKKQHPKEKKSPTTNPPSSLE